MMRVGFYAIFSALVVPFVMCDIFVMFNRYRYYILSVLCDDTHNNLLLAAVEIRCRPMYHTELSIVYKGIYLQAILNYSDYLHYVTYVQ